jgi:hypothetical protein
LLVAALRAAFDRLVEPDFADDARFVLVDFFVDFFAAGISCLLCRYDRAFNGTDVKSLQPHAPRVRTSVWISCC